MHCMLCVWTTRHIVKHLLLHKKGKKRVNTGTGSHRVFPLASGSLPRIVNSVRNGTVTSGNLSKVIGAEGCMGPN